ncbi:ATP synthase gamma chain [Mycoplasmopsis meleagridis]|uniref:ATP synthase gamma chain n=1 Tax=Mycoplasmopsis meleagridis ATCC 25294 TaxID=1264554 RepID=A0A0F5H0H2_9BACT|nr:ATP synthase F1 subunit gamma [Mycoplasmopsis meleagridis]KKB26625.1 ATP synthase gamma chain [Mycoplasmopsis meleagridis ATCC 25294]OAD18260.1 ATP synthase gamma chain [Mycoplasmopsis meleagridis]VEU77679.1 ATP synthase gamma chain [Mycoplasmopsis meleagridis]
MAGLQAIKNRIDAVHSIKKITHAMELVATSKLKKARNEYEQVSAYASVVNESFYSILEELSEIDKANLFVNNNSGRKLHIILTADIGLAGSYNSSVIKLAKNIINKRDKLIVIGIKGIANLAKIYKEQIVAKYNSDSESDHYRLMLMIMRNSLELYNQKEIDSINIIYSKYINNIVQEETIKQIFPFDLTKRIEIKKSNENLNLHSQIEFEPSVKNVFNEAIPLYVGAQLYEAYASSKLSEFASRRSAMESATDNAENLIDDLQVKYNSKRQSNITQELNEIIAGADAV